MTKPHKWQRVPVPARMRHLDRDRRGYPIPMASYRDGTGQPHFTINDIPRMMSLMREDRCGICGERLKPQPYETGLGLPHR